MEAKKDKKQTNIQKKSKLTLDGLEAQVDKMVNSCITTNKEKIHAKVQLLKINSWITQKQKELDNL